jgi:hypothetical protein
MAGDPTPADHGRRHALWTLAANAENLAVQPPLPENTPDDARAYRVAFVATLTNAAQQMRQRASA